MAKKRHTVKRRTHHRRSKVGAISGSLSTLLFAAGGAVAAAFIVKALPATMDAKIKAAIPLAVGVGLPMFVKSPIVKDVALGMGVQGTVGLLKEFKVISGIGGYELPMIGNVEFMTQSPAPIVAGAKNECYTF